MQPVFFAVLKMLTLAILAEYGAMGL